MVKLRFIGEGPSDVGHVAEDDDSGGRQGCLFHFVRNILERWKGRHVSITASRDMLPHLNLGRRRQRGYEAKVRAALVQAHQDRIDGVVVVVDEPPTPEKLRLSRMQKGRQTARNQGVTIPCALGVAIPEIEAWLLADDQARRKHLTPVGQKPLPTRPEALADAKSHFLTLYTTIS